MVCHPRLVLLCVGVLAHVVRCFLHGPGAAVVYSTRHHASSRRRRNFADRRRHVSLTDAATPPLPRDLFIAVLRDVQLERAQEVARALYKGGFRMVSITTNTNDFGTILRHLTGQEEALPGLTLGASSVCSVQQVDLAFACGARFISSTYWDVAVVRRTKERGMISIPGVSTPAQARGAAQAGGDILKAFPSKDVPTECFRSILESVSSNIPVIISGGLEAVQLEAYSASGASGFAVGRTLFEPEMTLAEIEAKARCFISGGRQVRWARTPHATGPLID